MFYMAKILNSRDIIIRNIEFALNANGYLYYGVPNGGADDYDDDDDGDFGVR